MDAADVDPLAHRRRPWTPPLFVEPPPMDAANVDSERPPVDTAILICYSLPVIGPSPMDAASLRTAPSSMNSNQLPVHTVAATHLASGSRLPGQLAASSPSITSSKQAPVHIVAAPIQLCAVVCMGSRLLR
ncbi:hypothetical protein EDB89DRAFT_2071804 [Lactarius sanguifluus]|nr:hypothetical protein EDB89DRAFT_2071804 [Lactarius sanguifluus]